MEDYLMNKQTRLLLIIVKWEQILQTKYGNFLSASRLTDSAQRLQRRIERLTQVMERKL